MRLFCWCVVFFITGIVLALALIPFERESIERSWPLAIPTMAIWRAMFRYDEELRKG